MDNNKKTIMVIPAWYPTAANPLQGSFFKEQVKLLSQYYNIVVLRVNRKYLSICSYLKKRIKRKTVEVSLIEECDNVVEYYADYNISFLIKYVTRILNGEVFKSSLHDGIDFDLNDVFYPELEEAIPLICDSINRSPDLVYGISAQGVAYTTQLVAKHYSVPFVFGEHNPFPVPGELIRLRERAAIESADLFLMISNDKLRQIMMQNIRLKQIGYVGNPVDEEMFVYNPTDHVVKTFIIVAAYNYIKNYDMFIRTLNRLTEIAETDFRVIIAGYDAVVGYTHNGSELEAKIQASKFADKVEMIKKVERSEMSALYNRADAFVMTSIQEGQPCSAMEAACCGLPIFATRCGGIDDYVDDSIGRLVPILDCEGLANHLNDFLAGRITFDSEIIRGNVVRKYGRKAYMSTICHYFDELIYG